MQTLVESDAAFDKTPLLFYSLSMKRLCLLLILIAICAPKTFAFNDVSSQDDEEAINFLYDFGIVNGYYDGTYRPLASINRAELLKILVMSKVDDVPSDGRNCFNDVAEDWYAKYVCYAKEQEWVSGYKDGTFAPEKSINRAEAIVMALKVFDDEIEFKFGDAGYLDVPDDAWYTDYLYAAKFNGLLADASYFYPANQITRGDVATVLYRILDPVGEVILLTEPEETEEEDNTPYVIVSGGGAYVEPAAAPVVDAAPVIPEPVTITNPFAGENLYVDPDSDSKDVAEIASQPVAKWFGDWNSDIEVSANKYVTTVTAAGALPVMVIYNIPNRDCGSYSAGGSSDGANYLNWVQSFANGIGDRKAVVIVEPDALAHDCMFDNSVSLISQAVDILKSKSTIYVYLDSGHSNWQNSTEMAERLIQANVAKADGFALNVSNFHTTADNLAYGKEISALIGGKHFIIDTGRNGNGSNGEWCNPSGRSLGQNPTTNTGEDLVDAYLWIKPPGESDGTCNGGPSAGTWWLEYALGLVSN